MFNYISWVNYYIGQNMNIQTFKKAVYSRNTNYDVVRIATANKGDYLANNSQTNDSAIGVA